MSDALQDLYKCLSDPTRLRTLVLLRQGPLCVRELQQALDEPQAKLSKHLGYMRARGLLAAQRKANWTFYLISPQAPPLLNANLDYLASSLSRHPQLKADQHSLNLLKKSDRCA